MDNIKRKDLADDLAASKYILDKCKNVVYAQNLYASMCNMQWLHSSYMFEILKDEMWHCSWRASGGIVADLRDKGEDYMKWYCSGLQFSSGYGYEYGEGFVSEGTVTEEIKNDLSTLGWSPVDWPDVDPNTL